MAMQPEVAVSGSAGLFHPLLLADIPACATVANPGAELKTMYMRYRQCYGLRWLSAALPLQQMRNWNFLKRETTHACVVNKNLHEIM